MNRASTGRPDIEIGHHVVRRARVLNAEIAKRVDREGLAFLRPVLYEVDDQRKTLVVLALIEILDDLRFFVVRSVQNQRQSSAPSTQQIRNVKNPRVAFRHSTHTTQTSPLRSSRTKTARRDAEYTPESPSRPRDCPQNGGFESLHRLPKADK